MPYSVSLKSLAESSNKLERSTRSPPHMLSANTPSEVSVPLTKVCLPSKRVSAAAMPAGGASSSAARLVTRASSSIPVIAPKPGRSSRPVRPLPLTASRAVVGLAVTPVILGSRRSSRAFTPSSPIQ